MPSGEIHAAHNVSELLKYSKEIRVKRGNTD